jgi:hypothetical protein
MRMGKPGRKRPNAAQRLDPTNARHVDVQQDYVEAEVVRSNCSASSPRSFSQLKPEFGERRPQRSADGRFVIDDQGRE